VNFVLLLFISDSLMVVLKFVIIKTIAYCLTEFIEIVKENLLLWNVDGALKNHVADFTFLVRRINVNRHTPSAYVFLL
jgi:hypothetical protein